MVAGGSTGNYGGMNTEVGGARSRSESVNMVWYVDNRERGGRRSNKRMKPTSTGDSAKISQNNSSNLATLFLCSARLLLIHNLIQPSQLSPRRKLL